MVLSNNKDLHAGWAIALKLLTHEAKLIENVNLNIGIGKIWDEIWTEDPDTKIMAMARVREILMTLETLPIKSVTLVLGDQSVRAGLPHWAIDTRWNIHELRAWADEVKHALLGQGKGKAVAGANEFGDLAFRVR